MTLCRTTRLTIVLMKLKSAVGRWICVFDTMGQTTLSPAVANSKVLFLIGGLVGFRIQRL
jgi:hypothetical protein